MLGNIRGEGADGFSNGIYYFSFIVIYGGYLISYTLNPLHNGRI
jgi:hypothetical protein